MTAQPLTHIGHTIACRAGAVTVALTLVREGVYRVGIHTGTPVTGFLGREIDGVSYGDETTARAEARRMAVAYRDGATTEELAERRAALLDAAENWAKRRGTDAARRARDLHLAAAAIQPLAGRAQDDDLAARIAADLATVDTDARYAAATAVAQPPARELSGFGRLKAAHAAAMAA